METFTNRNGRKRRTFSAAVKPVKKQELLFEEEKNKAKFYGGFYKRVLFNSTNYTEAVNAFCARIKTLKKRILFLKVCNFQKKINKAQYWCTLFPSPFMIQWIFLGMIRVLFQFTS